MSINAVVWAQDDAPYLDDDPIAVAVLVAYARSAGPDGKGAYPGIDTMMRRTRLSDRTVQRKTDKLLALGLIRPGDQSLTARLPGNVRPPVVDVAMELRRPSAEGGRREKKRQDRERKKRGDTVTPLDDGERGDGRTPLGVTHSPERGDSVTGEGCPGVTQEELGEDRESLSRLELLVRQAAAVAAGDEKDFINWMKVKYPGKGPGWWRHIADNGDIHDHAADWKNERDAAATAPKRRPRPPWCEDPACDEPTRRYEREDGRWAKCPRCHPDMVTASQP